MDEGVLKNNPAMPIKLLRSLIQSLALSPRKGRPRKVLRDCGVSVDTCEVRMLPSSVVAKLTGGNLVIRGLTDQAKDILIQRDTVSSGNLTVTGRSGTMINGSSRQSFPLSKLSRDLRLELGGQVRFDFDGSGFTLKGHLQLTLRGTGDHEIRMKNVQVKKEVNINTAAGDDVVQLTNLRAGATRINTAGGDDRVVLSTDPAVVAAGSENLSGPTKIRVGAGYDVVDIRSTNATDLSVDSSGVAAVLLQNSRINGHLDLRGIGGEQTHVLTNVEVTRRTSIQTGNSDDHLGIYNSTLRGRTAIRLSGGDDVASIEESRFFSGLVLAGGGGHDDLTEDFQQNNVLLAAGTVTGFEHSVELVRAVHFSYGGEEGPEFWGRLTPAWIRAAVGVEQSPINIATAEVLKDDLSNIQFNYVTQSGLDYFNNGHTVQVSAKQGSSITVSGRVFNLMQFHLHLPSEHRIDGRQFDGELHLVHADALGNPAVVAVFIEKGESSNPLISQLAADPPTAKGQRRTIPTLDPAAVLPANQQYYHFNGSLTTPPASEGVKWFVLANPVFISQIDYDRLRTAITANNNRPVQSVNGRTIIFDKTA